MTRWYLRNGKNSLRRAPRTMLTYPSGRTMAGIFFVKGRKNSRQLKLLNRRRWPSPFIQIRIHKHRVPIDRNGCEFTRLSRYYVHVLPTLQRYLRVISLLRTCLEHRYASIYHIDSQKCTLPETTPAHSEVKLYARPRQHYSVSTSAEAAANSNHYIALSRHQGQ